MNKFDLEERLIDFSVFIIEIVNECLIQKQEIIYLINGFVPEHQFL